MIESEQNIHDAYVRSIQESLQSVVDKLLNGEIVKLCWCDNEALIQL